MEENDRDSEMHETFEHLFLEEYIASEGERKHIELMQSQLTNKKMLLWNLHGICKMQKNMKTLRIPSQIYLRGMNRLQNH